MEDGYTVFSVGSTDYLLFSDEVGHGAIAAEALGMTSNAGSATVGVLLFMLGGLAGAVFYLPFKRIRQWSWDLVHRCLHSRDIPTPPKSRAFRKL